jgi:hypothetical protein
MQDHPDSRTDEPQLMTLAEAATTTGLTSEALRKRIARRKLRGVKGNDGVWRVLLAPAEAAVIRAGQLDVRELDSRTDNSVRPDTRDVPAIKVLEAAVVALREAAQRAESETARERERGDREAATRAQAEGRAMVLEAEAQRARQEVAALRQELERWSAGGALARAWRALLWRRW